MNRVFSKRAHGRQLEAVIPRLAIAAAFCLAGVPARAQDSNPTAERQAAVRELYFETQAWIDAPPDPQTTSRRQAFASPNLTSLVNASAALDEGDYYKFQRAMGDFHFSGAPANVRAAMDRLQKAIHAEFDFALKKQTADFEAENLRITKAALATRSASEMDAVLDDFHRFEDELRAPHLVQLQVQSTVNQTRRFLETWQDYLSLKNAGQVEMAAQKLREVRSVSIYPLTDADIIAASSDHPLQKSGSTPSTLESLVGALSVHSIDQIHTLAIALQDQLPPNNIPAMRMMSAIHHLESTRFLVDIGYPGAAFNFHHEPRVPPGEIPNRASSPLASIRPALQPLIDAVETYALRSELEPGSSNLRAQRPLDYLTEVCARASKNRNWPLLYRALSLLEDPRVAATPPWVASEKNRLGDFIRAQNEERAGLKEVALASYRNALQTPSMYLPKDYIAKALARLEATSP